MSVELIARLNAKAQDIRMLPPGFDQLNPADVSHAISMFENKGARLLGRVVYAEQPAFARELSHELLLRLKDVARRERWHKISPLAKLSAVAVTVYCSPQRCHKCKGIGEKKWGAKVIVCPVCKVKVEGGIETGHGWMRVYYTDIANEIGIAKENMTRTWKPRYGLALRILMKWDEECWDGFRNALRRKRLDNRQRSV